MGSDGDRGGKRVAALPGFSVIDERIIGHDSVAEWDPLKLSVDVSELGITGVQAREWFESEQKLTLQLGDSRRVICSLSYADDDAAFERLFRRTGRLRRSRRWMSSTSSRR